MAIKKVKILDSGASAEYWRIRSIVGDSDIGTTIYVMGYLNSNARNDGKSNMDMLTFQIDIDIKNYNGKIMEACYNELKKNLFFEGGEDV